MAETHTNPGLDALWAYARSLPLNEVYMDKKQRDIELARQIGFNTEHPATNEYLHQFAQRVRAEEREACAKVADEMTMPDWVNEQIAKTIRARGQA